MTAKASSGSTAVLTIALCYLVAIFEGFDLQAAGVAAPALKGVFNLTPNQLSWFFSSSTFGLMLGAAVGGRLSDRFGRKAVLIASVAVFGAMSVLTGLAQDVNMLMLARFLTGAGIGGALPNLVALASENASPARKNTAVGLLYAGLPSGGALSSLITLLGGHGDWRTVFFVGGIAPLVAVPLLLFVLPDSQQQKAVAGQGKKVSFATAAFGEGRAARTLLLWVAFFLSLLTMYLLLNWLPTLMVARGLSRADASIVQMLFNVFGAIASMVTGLLMDRLSLRNVVILSFASAAVGLLALAGAPPAFSISMAVGALVGITMSMTQALLYAVAPSNYPTEMRGTGVGTAVSVGRLGSAAGPILAGMLLTSGRTPDDVLSILVPIILVAGVAALALAVLMKRAEAR